MLSLPTAPGAFLTSNFLTNRMKVPGKTLMSYKKYKRYNCCTLKFQCIQCWTLNLIIFVAVSVTKLYLTLLGPHGLQPTRLFCPWDFPDKNIGAGCYFILCTKVLNLHLLHWQVGSLPLSHQGSSKWLNWNSEKPSGLLGFTELINDEAGSN